jgi:hypothetical protein
MSGNGEDMSKTIKEDKKATLKVPASTPRGKQVNDVLRSKPGVRHYNAGTDYVRAKEKAKQQRSVVESDRHDSRHEQNMDAAQRELDMREAEGEDMSQYYVNPRTYKIEKKPKNSSTS